MPNLGLFISSSETRRNEKAIQNWGGCGSIILKSTLAKTWHKEIQLVMKYD